MNILTKALLVSFSVFTVSATSAPATSLKHAEKATELRQAVYALLGSNMKPLGAMAKGQIPMDAEMAEKNAKRIHQLSLMIADYNQTDTSMFKVKTESLNAIWTEQSKFADSIEKLTLASANLEKVSKTKDSKAIKQAIGEVGKSCGGCHKAFKAD